MEHENKMGYEPVNQLILKMSLPPLCSMFLQYSYNLVDSMFVAKINEQALTAVSLSFPITTLMLSLSIWVGVGINVLIAGYLGERKQKEANTVTTLGLMISILLGACVNILVMIFMKSYYAAFTTDHHIFDYGIIYMRVCAFMQVPNMVHIAIQKMLQATGNMITPMWFQIAGVVLNFILDPLLIFGIGPFPEMGIAGAALATVLGYTLSMGIALFILLFTKQKIRLDFKKFHFQWKMVRDIFGCGLPSFIMNALGAFMVTFVNAFLVFYSDTAVAFFGAYFKIQQLIVMTVNGLIQGCLPIMRFNYSANKKDRLKQTYLSGKRIAVCMMAFGTVLLLAFPDQILTLFSASEEMKKIGIPAIRIMSVGFIFSGISIMTATYAQTTNKLIKSVAIQLLRQAVLLLPVMGLLNAALHISGIWIAFPVTEIAVCVLAVILIDGRAKKTNF